MKRPRYIVHEREYVMASISSVMHAFFEPPFIHFFDGTFRDMVLLVRDGRFYHCQRDGDRERIARQFLKSLPRRRFNFSVTAKQAEALIRQYQTFLKQPTSSFNATTIEAFDRFYGDIIPYAYAGFDTLDEVQVLPRAWQVRYRRWVKSIRRKAERVYKDGELVFMPRYLVWLRRCYRISTPARLLAYLTFTELLGFLKDQGALPTRRELERRECCMLVVIRRRGMSVRSDSAAEREARRLGLFREIDEHLDRVDEVRGIAAYPGRVRGTVRVIRRMSDLRGFRRGQVIVSPMTQPHFIAAMKLASAFVTDEGGTLSHAAIVARELKKPCVIGTKVATKVFKDGDRVEVDATRGIVRKV